MKSNSTIFSRCVALLVLGAWLLVPAIGCNTSGPTMYSVEGTLTHNGKPIPKMYIVFTPVNTDENPESTAMTDDNGRFELKCGSIDGVAAGDYKVYVQDPKSLMGGKSSEDSDYQKVLEKYGDPTKTTVQYTIDSNMTDFELTLD